MIFFFFFFVVSINCLHVGLLGLHQSSKRCSNFLHIYCHMRHQQHNSVASAVFKNPFRLLKTFVIFQEIYRNVLTFVKLQYFKRFPECSL